MNSPLLRLVFSVLLMLYLAAFSRPIATAADPALPVPAPNVVLFLVDDMGVMDSELGDDAFYETPNLRRLAERGMTFIDGYCAHPRCVPSRYAIQTGRFPCRDAMNAGSPESALRKHPTIGEAFAENGYATYFTGKWHLGKEEADWPHHRGYQTNIGGCHAGAPGSYFFPFHVTRKTGEAGKYGPLFGLEDGIDGEHLSERLTTETLAWIETQVKEKPDQPFFAFFSHYAVHTPIEGKPDEVAYFENKRNELPDGDGPAYLLTDGQTKIRRDNAEYASMLRTMDESLGELLDRLDKLGIADDTVIAFTSDHGGLSNRGKASQRGVATSNLPYRAGKGHLYEGGLRVPFLITYPRRVKAGSQSETLAIGTDLYPTLLDLAHIDLRPSDHADGISLVPSLTGKVQDRKRPIIFHSPLPRPDQTGDSAASAIRVADLKLVKHYFPLGVELYDLASDPYEQSDLAAERPDEAKQLQQRLEKILTSFEAMPPRQNWKDSSVTAPLASE